MNKTLWEKVLKFSFDDPNDEYGFSTRLALENHWTLYFTQNALLEYKKFMFLAATNNEMVSPSETVDIVWHQHLIFTNSYSDLCNLLGKRIEHIPSTHNKLEFEKFQKAKERTTALYESVFGTQSPQIWHYKNELDSLNLDGSKYEISKLRKMFLWYSIFLSVPVCLIIFPVLIKIQNPNFLLFYILAFGAAILFVEFYVSKSFISLYEIIKSNSILANLTPLELVFLKENKLEAVVHGVVNNLIEKKKIKILTNRRLQLIDENLVDNPYENCVIEIMKEFDTMSYRFVCISAMQKPIFEQLKKGTFRIRERIMDSKQFVSLVILTMIVLGSLLSIVFSRFITGIYRDKPILFLLIAIIVLVFAFASFYYLDRIINLMFTNIIPSSFKEEMRMNKENNNNWEWNYFLVRKYGSGKFVYSLNKL